MKPIERFWQRQRELNSFLWTTELAYCLVKHEQLLDRFSSSELAATAMSEVAAEAWFPNARGNIHYFGTVADMKEALETNFVVVAWSVAVFFVAEFESYVEARFPSWIDARRQETKSPVTVPRP